MRGATLALRSTHGIRRKNLRTALPGSPRRAISAQSRAGGRPDVGARLRKGVNRNASSWPDIASGRRFDTARYAETGRRGTGKRSGDNATVVFGARVRSTHRGANGRVFFLFFFFLGGYTELARNARMRSPRVPASSRDAAA